MLKKTLVPLVLLIVAVGGLAWFQRIDLMLALVKYQSANEFSVGPNRELSWAQGPQEAAEESRNRPPNIIVIMADDLGFNDISTFGGGVAGGRLQTPGIDQLAAQGAVFTQAYAGNATCAPSRAMVMTGRYPTRTGFEFTPTPSGMAPMVSMVANSMDNGLPRGLFNDVGAEAALPYEQQGLPSEEVTVAEVLRERGYYTAHIGKWHLGRAVGSRPNDQGFDDSLLMASGFYLPEDDPNVINAKLDFDPIDKFLWARMDYASSFNNGAGDDRFRPGGYLTDYWTDESIKVIKANKNRPFFLYLAHWGTHTPLQATREDYEAVGDIKPHRLRVYAAMIRALDRSVSRIVAALEEEGLADNTLVMFTSDNGGPGYIGLPDINAPYRGWKLTNFEGGLRVPMFIKWPSRIAPGTEIDTPVAHIDVMPTMAAAAQAASPEGVVIDGQNLLPLTTGAGEETWSRDTLFWQSGYYRVVRHGDWKLQISDRLEKSWLYDLAADPTEQNNLAQTHPDELAELSALLDEHAASARAPLYPYVVEMPVAVDKTLAEFFEDGDEYIYWPN
ncbi:MAG: arylsulfatase A-like enzyme [Halieaceae bacterium]|jgi:arylsulfatase A-like enzyme